jgi:hypothetical protein
MPARFRFSERKDTLVVSARFPQLFDEAAVQRLSSGFATTVLVRAIVYEQVVAEPQAVAATSLRVVYDLWDEEYRVRIVDQQGQRDQTFGRRGEALRAVTAIEGMPLAPLTAIEPGKRYLCQLVVMLNPVSDASLAEMRRWLTRRAGTGPLEAGAAVFGSVVSFFVNPQILAADRTLHVQSQPFYRPAVTR